MIDIKDYEGFSKEMSLEIIAKRLDSIAELVENMEWDLCTLSENAFLDRYRFAFGDEFVREHIDEFETFAMDMTPVSIIKIGEL